MYLASLILIAFVNTVRALSHEQASHEKTSRAIVRINSRGRVAITRRIDANRGGTRGRERERERERERGRGRVTPQYVACLWYFSAIARHTDMHRARCIKYRSIPRALPCTSRSVARVPRHALPHAEA